MPAKKPLVVIVGPTAVGKTAMAIDVCRALNGEVVTADSMQVYKGMDIGTAKPDAEERKNVPHHMIDIIPPDQTFNVAQYRDMAHQVIADIHARGRLPIVSGGTGLYVRAVLDEFLFPDQGSNIALRKRLRCIADEQGNDVLHRQLKTVDPDTAARLHPNDVRRVIRALEVYETTGKPMSEHLAQAGSREPRYDTVRIGLTLPREQLYARIDQRVDHMLQQGLVEEVKSLLADYDVGYTAFQGLGYKEIAAYLSGTATLDEARHVLQRETRRYAKRQLSWFRRDRNIHWFDLSTYEKREHASRDIISLIRESITSL